jgi:hypothetical protein
MPVCRAVTAAITAANSCGCAKGIPRESSPLRFLLVLDSVHVLNQISDGSRFSYQFLQIFQTDLIPFFACSHFLCEESNTQIRPAFLFVPIQAFV